MKVKQGGWFRRRMEPVMALFRQGLAPDQIALCIVLGALISVFPVLGTTTILCVAASVRFKVNLAAIQAVNWLFAGVQLLLIIPFLRIGEKLVGAPPLPLSPERVAELDRAGFLTFFSELGGGLVHAVVGWAAVAIPVAAVAYVLMIKGIRRYRAPS
jgi:uncharacterized protein (DUF2062 family)